MNYYLHLLVMIGIYLPLAYSLNLLVGYGGLLSFGHAAFYGIGAYTFSLLVTGYNVNAALALAAAVGLTSLVAFSAGGVALRFRGDLFLFVTLGFQMIVFVLLYNWVDLTKGPYGIIGIPRPALLGTVLRTPLQYFGLVVAMNAVLLPLLLTLYRSPFGKALKALRDNETAAAALGINPKRLLIQAFVLAAAFAAIPGVFYASYVTYIDPTSFTLRESIFLVAIILIGGAGNRIGPFVGVLIMILLPEALRLIGLPDSMAFNVREIIYGASLVLLMFLRPQGVTGDYRVT